MESIILGQNAVSVTPLCLGTWAWGDKLFWNYGNEYGSEQVEQAFNAAIEAGITFFDTAEVYGLGLSEELLGQFIKKTDKQVQIATKFGPLPWRFSAESVSDALTESLKRLQVQQVALYQVHWPFTFFLSQETLMNALATEVELGRIKAIGVSNYSQSQMQEAHEILARRGIPLAVNQVRYSLLTRQVETQGIISAAKQLGVTILAYSPLAQGLLTGKYTTDNTINPTGARKIDPRFSKDNLQKIEPVISLLRTIGEKYSRTPAQVALNWLIAQGNVIPISGVKTAEQVQQNAGALGWKLSDDEVAQLDRISRPWLN
ncbi:aldo/keto reductase [Rivularia sp. UHCC 0363]|uniref:aldo/keto reductase n=1 Tax=Rivularia sp. UHCC 0363 TaxID=3110244 RepID=UPI002B20D58D|nr:aldo/keto reductase [Rivularia sp. UHCC 0363]MEA5597724.1 aldo/keto reductase [Rivularia sp. UHCC 0363]